MVSIVIVHWNTPDLLESCLNSVTNDRSSSIREVVVVDCASSGTAYADVVGRFPGVRLIRSASNDGYAAGCNLGSRSTSSDVILFLNADTEVAAGAAEKIAECFNLSPRIGLVAPLLLNLDGTVQSSGYEFPGIMNVLCDLWPVPNRICASKLNGRLDPGNRFHPYAIDYPLGAAIAVRRSALDQVGGWDESYGMYSEEIDLAKRLDQAGWLRLLEPRAEVIHHGGASTGQRPAEMQAALWRSRGRYHRRWSSRGRQLIIQAIASIGPRLSKDKDGSGVRIRNAFAAGMAD